jgi:hypothetical protein
MNLKTGFLDEYLASATQSDVGEGEHDRRDYRSQLVRVTAA